MTPDPFHVPDLATSQRLVLLASRTRHNRLHAAAFQVESVDPDTRRVSGMLVPYGEVGLTTIGPVIVPGPGLIALPAEPGRVKLVDEHQDPPRSVGYAVSFTDTPQGLRGSFHLARTPDGDRVLAEFTADEHGGRARDGFSVELHGIELQEARGQAAPYLAAGALSAVAAVVTPAWANAREDGLAASHTTTDERHTTMRLTTAQRDRLAHLLGLDNRSDQEDGEFRALCVLAGLDPDSDDTTAEAVAALEVDDVEAVEPAVEPAPADPAAALAASRRTAVRTPTTTRPRRSRHSLQDMYAAQARVLSGRSRASMEAALSDITNTANVWTARDDYAGLLWQGLEYTRRYVPLLMPGDLPSYKGTGWRWVIKPEVADYAGDKAPVPSNAPTTEATSWNAARLAGAHDLDRKFTDFGDQEFIDSYYTAMRESYAMKSDDKARAFILSMAGALGAAGTTLYHAAAKAAQGVFDATGGLTVDYLLVNSSDVLDLLDTPANALPDPRILEMFGVSPDKFIPTTGVAAGTVVGGVRQAGRFRELSSTPIRVEAINVADGGVDGGVFGYYATEDTFDGGVKSATFAAV
jgi:hypothetical protein